MDTLETQRLIIRPFGPADLNEAHAVLDLDLAWSGPGFTLDQRRQRLQFYVGLAQWNDTGRLYGLRAVVLRESRQLIGICGFHPDSWSARWKAAFWPKLFNDTVTVGTHASMELGLGYSLAHSARRQGYATEAVEALLAHAFQTLQIGRVFAATERGNDASWG